MTTLLLYFLTLITTYILVEHLEIFPQTRLNNLTLLVPGDENDFLVPPCDLLDQNFYFLLLLLLLFLSSFIFLFASSSSSFLPTLPSPPPAPSLPLPQLVFAECSGRCQRMSWREYMGKKKHLQVLTTKERRHSPNLGKVTDT